MDHLQKLRDALWQRVSELPLQADVEEIQVFPTLDSEGQQAVVVRIVLADGPPGGVPAQEAWEVSDFVTAQFRGVMGEVFCVPFRDDEVLPLGTAVIVEFVAADELSAAEAVEAAVAA